MKNLLPLILTLLTVMPVVAAQQPDKCPTVKMQVERLPDLNVPRLGHAVFYINGEVVAAGGHTTGFVPTQTAEYYRDGAWHLMQMAYPHDHGTAVVTPTGQVLLAGGHQEALGIGQTFTLELYDPATHSFKGYGCLVQKRCFANALPVDSGRIVITGNWYRDDAIELYDGSRQCKFVQPVAQQRSLPFIIRTAKDNAIVFSDCDIHSNAFDTIVVDRLKGDPFTVPLFETWRPMVPLTAFQGACFIGDEEKGDYTSLLPVIRGDSLVAIAQVQGETFSLLPTTSPIPMRSQWGRICWYAPILADRKQGRAYMVGYGENYPENTGDHRFYVAAIDYLSAPAPITLFYSEPIDSVGRYQPVLTDSGDLMVVGGILQHNNNYDAASTVLLLHVGTATAVAEADGRLPWWLWLLLAVLLIAAITVVIKSKTKAPSGSPCLGEEIKASPEQGRLEGSPDKELIQRIYRLMEEQQLYLNSELKVQDVADALGTNRTYVSNCIKNIRGCSFSQFVNGYRVEYAKQLLRSNAGIKLSEVWACSGFSSESSFFRAFKAVTGTTPKDWIAS